MCELSLRVWHEACQQHPQMGMNPFPPPLRTVLLQARDLHLQAWFQRFQLQFPLSKGHGAVTSTPCTKPAKHSRLAGIGNDTDQLAEIRAGCNEPEAVCVHACIHVGGQRTSHSHPAPEG